MPTKNKPSKFQIPPEQRRQILSLLKLAITDPDQASLMVLGPSLSEATGSVLVLKGNNATRWLYNLLIGHKLLTPGKPIARVPINLSVTSDLLASCEALLAMVGGPDGISMPPALDPRDVRAAAVKAIDAARNGRVKGFPADDF